MVTLEQHFCTSEKRLSSCAGVQLDSSGWNITMPFGSETNYNIFVQPSNRVTVSHAAALVMPRSPQVQQGVPQKTLWLKAQTFHTRLHHMPPPLMLLLINIADPAEPHSHIPKPHLLRHDDAAQLGHPSRSTCRQHCPLTAQLTTGGYNNAWQLHLLRLLQQGLTASGLLCVSTPNLRSSLLQTLGRMTCARQLQLALACRACTGLDTLTLTTSCA